MSTDSAAPDRSRRWRVLGLSALGVIVLVLVGLWFAGRAWAASTLDDYDAALEKWRTSFGQSLISGTARLPDGVYDVKSSSSAASLIGQRRGCSSVAGIARAARRADRELPVLEAGTAGLFSGDLRAAEREARTRRDAVKSYVARAGKAFDQVRADCRWNITFNEPSTTFRKINDLYEKADGYLDATGTVSGGYECVGRGACISATRAKRIKYADLRRRAITLETKTIVGFFGDGCEDTSYGPVMCKNFRVGNTRFGDVRLRGLRVIRNLTRPDDPAIDGLNDDVRSVRKANLRRSQANLKRTHPAAWRDRTVRKEPGTTDIFLRFEARRLVASLQKERKALAKSLEITKGVAI